MGVKPPQSDSESSLGPDSRHPIISLSGIPSAVMVFKILHAMLASTVCAANPLARMLSPRWPCSDGTLSRLCTVCCSPIRCATCVFRAGLSLECCGCVPEHSQTPMQAGHPFSEESGPLVIDRCGDCRLPHRRRRHRTQRRLALMQSDARSVRQATPAASNRGRFCWSDRRR